MPVDAQAFKSALGRLPGPVTVVTAVGPDGPVGMTASSFTSLSLSPPLVLVCVAHRAGMHAHLSAASGFAVSVLSADQQAVSNRFAGPFDGPRFADLPHEPAPHSGAPWLGGAIACVDCALHAVHDGGDHSIFVGRVEAVRLSPDPREALDPLLYFAGQYRRLGP
jgi:flavin reductase (DIM6/NTAB) family NADH-FMN oxidoreductase RutF